MPEIPLPPSPMKATKAKGDIDLKDPWAWNDIEED